MFELHLLSLRLRLFLGMGFLLTSIFVGMSFFNYWEGKRVIKEQIFEVELPTFTDNIYYRVQEKLQHSTILGSSLAQNVLIQDWCKQPQDSLMLQMLHRYEQAHGIHLATLIHDSLQRVYSQNRVAQLNPDVRRDTWYYEFKNSGLYRNFNLYQDPQRKKLMFFVNHKIFTADSTFLGVVGMGTELDTLLKSSLQNTTPLTTNLLVVDSRGFIKIRKDRNEKFWVDNIANIAQIEGIQKIATEIFVGRDTQLSYRSEKGLVFVRTKYLKDFDWYIILEIEENEILSPMRRIFITNIILGIIIITLGASGAYFYAKNLTNPIISLTQLAQEIGQGNINFVYEHKKFAVEIDQLAEAFDKMIYNLRNVVDFAQNIKKGNIYVQLEKSSHQDQLAEALLAMQKSLQDNYEQNQRRIWINDGLNTFTGILRNENPELIFDILLKQIVDYLQIQQAGIFVFNAQKQNLELKACYAYGRKKFLEKNITLGEGILGQTFIEQKSNYLKNIPQDYLQISSGLGDAKPDALLLVPLVFNQKAVGIIEMATFGEFESKKIELMEKFAEVFASFLISSQSSLETQNLLKAVQMSAENLRSQEEEMRQNLEELMATQEEAQRKEAELLKKIAYLENKLENLS